MTTTSTTRRTTATKGARKPSLRTIKDPGPFVSRWYTLKKDLDKALERVGGIAEEMNSLSSMAKTRFDLGLPFITRNGIVEDREPAPIVVNNSYQPPAQVSDGYVPPEEKRVSAPLPTQGHVPGSSRGGVEVTTMAVPIAVGHEHDLRSAADDIMSSLQAGLK